MNDLIVDVKLWGESVGSLYWEKESNAALFDYERKFECVRAASTGAEGLLEI